MKLNATVATAFRLLPCEPHLKSILATLKGMEPAFAKMDWEFGSLKHGFAMRAKANDGTFLRVNWIRSAEWETDGSKLIFTVGYPGLNRAASAKHGLHVDTSGDQSVESAATWILKAYESYKLKLVRRHDE